MEWQMSTAKTWVKSLIHSEKPVGLKTGWFKICLFAITAKWKSLQQLSAQFEQAMNSMLHTQQGLYNSSLERYYDEYRAYLETVYHHALRASAQIALPLHLSNVGGSAPATNIDIILRSPDGMSFIKKRQDRPEAPTAPRKPSVPFDLKIDNRPPLIASHMPNLREIMRENAADQPKLTLSPGVAQFSVPALKHKQQTTLLPVLLDFGAPENIRNITISYEIHAHEMLEPVHQQLHLKLAA